MPVPSAQGILSTLQPYPMPNSAGAGLGVGALLQRNRAMAEEKRQFGIEDARKQQYFGFQRQQWQSGVDERKRGEQIKAFTALQAAMDSGDVEQATAAANQLRILGVGVRELSGEEPSAPAAPNPLAAGGLSSKVAAARAAARPEQGTPEDYDPGGAYVQPAAQPAAKIPSVIQADAKERGYDQPVEPQAAPEPDADVSEEDRIRPTPARAQMPQPRQGIPGERQDVSLPAGGQRMPGRGFELDFGGKIIRIDPESVHERQVQRVKGVLQPIFESSTSPEEKKAAQMALNAAAGAVGIVPPEDAVKLGIDVYEKAMERMAKLARAKVAGASRASAGSGYDTRLGKVGDDFRTYLNQTQNQQAVKGARISLQNARHVLEMANSSDALAQFSAKADLLKETMRGALSDKDVARFEGAAGKWNQARTWVNTWTAGGQIPPDVLRQIKEIAIAKVRAERERLEAVAQQFVDSLDQPDLVGNLTPEELERYKDAGYRAIAGVPRPGRGGRRAAAEEERPPRKAPAKPARGGGKSAPAPGYGGGNSASSILDEAR